MKLFDGGVFLVNGREICGNENEAQKALGKPIDIKAAKESTISYGILKSHNKSGNMEKLNIGFDALTSHDITYVGIIQTARASGLTKFPMPYVLTNCHNSLCAVGGTINEDDHVFGLSCAKRYGGIYVPPHQAVIHQYAREMLSRGGSMILGSDSHTRYGALGTMAMGEGGPELVKQLLGRTYDIDMPGVIAVYLKGEPIPGVGPQDIALAIIGEVFDKGYVKNKVMEFVGPGVSKLSMDYRIGVDVMTTETTCLSSIWVTDERTKEFYDIHGRGEAYKELTPGEVAYYDGCIEVDLSTIRPMIAMPFHPSNVYTIADLKANLMDVLDECEKKAKVSLGEGTSFSLKDKVVDGELRATQGIIAGCAGGGYENICDAADIIRGFYTGADEFSLSVYPSSTPIYMELMKNGCFADLMAAGAVIKTAFCGPCFGAGDTPANNGFSIRHSTRNFPNREGSKLGEGQISSVALMDARSIAATAANEGFITGADEVDINYRKPKYFFDKTIYEHRIFDAKNVADESVELRFGPNIKDWPVMPALPENLVIKVVSEIHDPVTTTDELIPSGETSSYRSNPLRLAEFTLSRKDPEYVGRAKAVQEIQRALESGSDPWALDESMKSAVEVIRKTFPAATDDTIGVGSTIFAVKPGDGSAREQAASCQRVLGGWANVAEEYATKRYRSNLINWGMIPFLIDKGELPFKNGDVIFVPGIYNEINEGKTEFDAYVVNESGLTGFKLKMDPLTETEKDIISKGCLMNYYRSLK